MDAIRFTERATNPLNSFDPEGAAVDHEGCGGAA